MAQGPAGSHDPPQLKDVAALAGVSVPTVSRVLSGTSPVSESKRRLVLAAVAELRYVPNPAARALATGARTTVAVLASETTHYGYAATIEGVEQEARRAGFAVLIGVIGPGTEGAEGAIRAVLGHSIAGIIVLEFDEAARAALPSIPRHVPVVCAGSPPPVDPSIPHSRIDDYLGARMATRHLLALGHRRTHYVGPLEGPPGTGRFHGWRSVLDEAGIAEQPFTAATWNIRSAYQIGLRLAQDADLTGVVCANDDIAFAVMRALHDQGRRVPADVSVTGFDDTPVSQFTTPSLTTIAQDFPDMGRRAFVLMRRRLDGDTAAVTSDAKPILVVRESTGPAPT